MKNQKYLMQMLPYMVAIVSFFAIAALYFAPQFEGKELKMHDITQFQGMSHDIDQQRAATGEDPQWTGNLFGGMPAYLISIRYDSTVFKYVMKVFDFIGAPTSQIFIAMFGFWLMLLMWGVNPWVGIVPSLAYGLSTYFFIIIGAGHYTKMMALAYVPLLMGAVFYAYRRNMWLGAALAAFFGSLEILANHPQIAYYFVLVLVAYWINEGIRAFKQHALPHFAKVTGLLALAAVLAVGANFAPLWYINQHAKDTIRGGTELSQGGTESQSRRQGGGLDLDYATAWSYGITESFNMFIPDLMGGASSGSFSKDGPVASSLGKYNARGDAAYLPSYWGEQPMTAGPTYIGAVIIFLCVLGLFLLRGRSKWWIVAIMAVAILLSWGKNFMWFTELFFDILPGYNKFRTVSMILVIVEWCVPFVAALVLCKLWSGNFKRNELIGGLKKALYITGGVALLFALFGSSMFSFSAVEIDKQFPSDVVSAMQAERLSMLRGDAWRSLLFVLMGAGVVWLYGLDKIRRGALIALLAVLVCADMIPVNQRFLSHDMFVAKHKTQIQPTSADSLIMRDKTLGYRVANFSVSPFNDATTSYFHRSIGGYHGAKLQRYQDLIDHHLSTGNWGVYDMLNTKYLITADQQTGRLAVEQRATANGAAWFVDSVSVVATPDQEIAALSRIDTKVEAVVDKRFAGMVAGVDINADSTARIELVSYLPNHLTYKYSAARQGLVVFSEIYYDKGWQAYIDGIQAPYMRADYVLRAMVVPEGDHTVEFRFRAPDFTLVSNITLISSLLIIVCLVAAVVAAVLCKRKKRDGSQQQ